MIFDKAHGYYADGLSGWRFLRYPIGASGCYFSTLNSRHLSCEGSRAWVQCKIIWSALCGKQGVEYDVVHSGKISCRWFWYEWSIAKT